VRLNDSARSNIDQIKLLNVPSRFGPVPLMNVADVSFGAGPAQITRYDRSRNITITADRGTIPLGEASAIARQLPAMRNLPAGVRPVESGEAELQGRIFGGFALAMVTGIFCIYALLVLLFHDVLQPITILSALPPSAGGAFVMLWLLKMDLPAIADRTADADGHRDEELDPAGRIRSDGAPRTRPEPLRRVDGRVFQAPGPS
jgi:multidrug efflux pump subunit AcrB